MSRFTQAENSYPFCDGGKQIWSRSGSAVTKGTSVKQATYCYSSNAEGRSGGLGASLREGGGAVALLVELLTVHPNLPSAEPLAFCRKSEHVAVWSYGQALRALREVVVACLGKTRQSLHYTRSRLVAHRAWPQGVGCNTEGREVEEFRCK